MLFFVVFYLTEKLISCIKDAADAFSRGMKTLANARGKSFPILYPKDEKLTKIIRKSCLLKYFVLPKGDFLGRKKKKNFLDIVFLKVQFVSCYYRIFFIFSV